jgi:hypothetical protein
MPVRHRGAEVGAMKRRLDEVVFVALSACVLAFAWCWKTTRRVTGRGGPADRRVDETGATGAAVPPRSADR